METSSTLQSSETLAGMGAILHDQGVAFRVWAPHANAVSVTGAFNDWSDDANPMTAEGNGYWYLDITGVKACDQFGRKCDRF